ncbi:hypothetical protein EDWATA_03926 [Edwardsiella tarda ATCC 23685]|uniref:Uncharacterized protein n=1 Tax=Edwardsiella tarda ATCC 23685 TaxID=500638 RepID=D4FAV5_EDWTA|nr:hypothetical protein EDWATA_03926 [Edwardsiella tarda ATCC 23685]
MLGTDDDAASMMEVILPLRIGMLWTMNKNIAFRQCRCHRNHADTGAVSGTIEYLTAPIRYADPLDGHTAKRGGVRADIVSNPAAIWGPDAAIGQLMPAGIVGKL